MTWKLTGSKYIWQSPVLGPYFVPFSNPKLNVFIYVYTQLQAPGSRLRTPNGAFDIGSKDYH